MKLNETLKKLHKLFVQYAPENAVLLDFKQGKEGEYVVLCQVKNKNCTSYAILHLNSSGRQEVCYYYNALAALMAF